MKQTYPRLEAGGSASVHSLGPLSGRAYQDMVTQSPNTLHDMLFLSPSLGQPRFHLYRRAQAYSEFSQRLLSPSQA
jgi:hypothetical protein